MSDTTAMIEVTATMLPSTVINDRSFEPQIASSAMPADSRSLFTQCPNHEDHEGTKSVLQMEPFVSFVSSWSHLSVLRSGVDLHGRAFLQVADRIVRTGHDLVARFEACDDLEVF